jgi:molybdopterin-guanine dinucleotide biosynthesis protein A
MLIREVEASCSVVDEVVVCVNDEVRKTKYAAVLEGAGLDGVRFAVDESCAIGGPNVGILAGLKTADADWCMTLPCDMPLMKPQVIKALFDAAEEGDVAVPMWPDGRLETLIMVLRQRSGLEVAETLCLLGREHSDDFFRGAEQVKFVSPIASLKAVDANLESFVNINSQEDLTNLPLRNTEGSLREDFQVFLRGPVSIQLKQLRAAARLCLKNKPVEAATVFAATAEALEEQEAYFWAAVSRERQGSYFEAANNYGQEVELLLDEECSFLADRALDDKTWCDNIASGTDPR